MDKFPAIVELFGHRRIAGFVSETQIAGSPFLSVEVPSFDGRDGFLRHYSANAIYCINPVSEDVMMSAAKDFGLFPVDSYVYNPVRSDSLSGKVSSAGYLDAIYEYGIDDDDDDDIYDDEFDYDGGDEGIAYLDESSDEEQNPDEEIPF